MIEVPGAALAVAGFMKKLAFLSIGTNDLIQYTLAIDRTDDNVAHLYDPLHPAVVFLVAHTIRAAEQGRRAGRGLRRDGGRGRADAPAARPRAAVLDASGAAAGGEAAGAALVDPEVEALAQRILRSEDAERTRGLPGRLVPNRVTKCCAKSPG